MLRKSLIGIIIAVFVIVIFVLALTNPNLRENKETWFGFIDVNPEQPSPIQEQKQSSITSNPTQKEICDESYPDVCILPYPPDLDCGEIGYSNFRVVGNDPHGFDRDNDGIGCES